MSRVTLAVYNRASTLVAEPTLWHPGPLFLDELDDTGSFSINVQNDDPDLADIEAGHILVVSLDASPVWRGVVRQMTVREVAEDEAGQYTTISGTGEAGRLDEMVVYPVGGLGRFPFSDERSFNWTAPEFDDSGWDAVVVTPANYGESTENYGLPEGFPDGDAEWIWSVDSSGTVAASIEHMRKATTAASTGVREAWSAADDRNEVWLEGTSILKSSDAPYDGRTTAVELLVTEGPLQLAARVENRNDLKAGLLFTLGTPKDDSASPIVNTDATWLVKPAAATLGMNAGQIMVQLIADATARGENPPTLNATAALDADDNAWTVYEEVSVPVGASYLDVLRQLVDLEMCDFRMSADGYTLNLYEPGGAGGTVAYTLGDANLTSLTWDITPPVSTALLIRWARGYTDTEDAALVTASGRRTQLLALGGVASESAAETQGGKVIDQFGVDRFEVSASIDPETVADEPYTKYHPGDSITCPGPDGSTLQRVMAVGMGVDDVGNPMWEIQLNATIAEQAKREQLMLRRMANGTIGGRSQTTTIPYEPRALQPPEPQSVDWSMAGSITTVVGTRKAFARAVRVTEFRMELEGDSIVGTYTARLLKNGTPISGSEVSLTAEGEKYVTLATVLQQRPAGHIQAEITGVGSGATLITLTAEYV